MRNNSLFFIITIVCICLTASACNNEKKQEKPYQWQLIEGFPKPQVPANNPMSSAKVALGSVLFHDKDLSFNKQQSCSSCHLQANSFAEPLKQSIGSTGAVHRRNSLALVNIAYNKTLTWAHDGITSIEQQILLPMFGESPIELGITGHETEVLKRFDTQRYNLLFQKAFPEQTLSFDLIVKSLASYVRSLISLNSPFDRYAYYMEDNAISTSAIRGMELFFSEKFECHHCHGGFNFTQSTSHEKQLIDLRPFHNTGLYNIKSNLKGVVVSGYPEKDIGLAEISMKNEDNGRFRAPTLRNIQVTAPYMHDGSIATLSDVLDFYAAGGRKITSGNYQGDGRENNLKSELVKGFELSEQNKSDLLDFLATLTDESFLNDPKHAALN